MGWTHVFPFLYLVVPWCEDVTGLSHRSAGDFSARAQPWSMGLPKSTRRWIPSGKHTKSYWKWLFIVDFPIENGGSFHSYVTNYQRAYRLLLKWVQLEWWAFWRLMFFWECLGANVCQEREVPGDKQVAGSWNKATLCVFTMYIKIKCTYIEYNLFIYIYKYICYMHIC